jgi:hypothetical protein
LVNRSTCQAMKLESTDEETAALLKEVDQIIDGDRYFLSPRVQTLKAIRARPADDARRCGCCAGAADRVVQRVSAPGRAQSGRKGRAIVKTAVLDWRADRLVCSRCGGRHIDMVGGTERR